MSENLTQGVAEPPPILKYCPRCEQWKDRSEFNQNRTSPDGLCLQCRACKKEMHRDYYRRNADKIKAAQRARRPAKRPKLTEEERRERRKETNRAATRRYQLAHPEKVRERKQRWNEANREKKREANRRSYERRKAARPPKPSKLPKVKPVKPPRPEKPPLILDPKLQQAIAAFLAAKGLKRPKTQERYEATLRYFGEYLVKTNLPQWPEEPEEWADNVNAFLAAEKARKLADQTLLGYYRDLTCFLRWIRRRKKIVGDISELMEMIEKPSKSRPLPKVIREDEAARLIAILDEAAHERWLNLRDRALIILALDSGIRIGELAAMTLDKLDPKHRTIKATETKGNADRTIVFSEQAAGPLNEWLKKREELNPPDQVQAIFLSDYRKQGLRSLTDSGMRQALDRWTRRAGIEQFNFHRLRHSYAVYSLRAQVDLLDIQKQMGHASIATTAIYTRVDDAGRQDRHNLRNPLAYLQRAAA